MIDWKYSFNSSKGIGAALGRLKFMEVAGVDIVYDQILIS